MATLTHWFVKHPPTFSDKYAVKIMHKKLETIEKALKEDPDDLKYLAELAKTYEMMCDFFAEKNIDPRTLI